MRPDVKVRMATADDAPALGALAEEYLFAGLGLDWTQVYPYWLVAEVSGEVVACIQVLGGKPIGRMDYLMVRPDLGLKLRAHVVLALTDAAANALRAYGSEIAGSMIPDALPEYLRVAERRGWRRTEDVGLVLKRLH